MEVPREMEIRSLDVSITQRLANMFEGDDSILTLLMGNIVKEFENPNSELRFTSRDIDSIRNHAQDLRRSPILILLEEWGTMGRNRPKIHHLMNLFIKCQLFRASDYIAELVGEPIPPRPESGPAARININLPHETIESVVNEMSYPFSADETNRDKLKPTMNSPNINFDANQNSDSEVNNISIVQPLPTPIFNSDLIKFSTKETEKSYIPITVNSNLNTSRNLPALSHLIAGEHQELPDVPSSINSNLPLFSQIFGASSQTFGERSSESSDEDD